MLELTPATAAAVQRPVDEDHFLEMALDHVARHPLACFLDSAGPTGPRSGHALLSGTISGVFLQWGERFSFHDFADGGEVDLDAAAFAEWLEVFGKRGDEPAGAALFPLLSYEAFNPWVSPSRPHPTWREPEGIWLLASSHYRYDRQTGILTAPAEEPVILGSLPMGGQPDSRTGWRETREAYHRKIDLVQDDIYEGIYYQANLSQRFLSRTEQHPLETYRLLRQRNPSPFMGIFRKNDAWVISGSPERLVERRDRFISARPIAGTQPRFDDAERDAASVKHLQTCAKERAEHLMLLDLIRNDLGRVAAWDTVGVAEFAVVETYSHVHHLVSQVEAQLRDGLGTMDLIRATFPGGTITGAPKISCMRRLAQLEEEARGPYTGSMGYIDTHGEMDLNILIRTLIQNGPMVCFHGGGGIVADSRHGSEYDETRQKCLALMEALGVVC